MTLFISVLEQLTIKLIKNKTFFLLALLLGFSTWLRLVRLDVPHDYYFDEVYHGVTAKAYALNDPRGYEWWHSAPEPGTAFEWLHPPLGKVFMALGWAYLGETPWAWRVPGALIGVGAIGLTYSLATILTKKSEVGLLAGLLASLDGLLLTQSRIGMNDMYVTFFMLATMTGYAIASSHRRNSRVHRRWLWISGMCAGLAIASKWSGVFVLGMIGLLELGAFFKMRFKEILMRMGRLVLVFGVLPLCIYVLSYSQFWIQGHTVEQFKELHQQIWWYQTNLKATHDYQSTALQWPLMIRPVWYYVDYSLSDSTSYIYNLANPLLLWIGLGLVGVSGIAVLVEKHQKLFAQLPFLLVCYFLAWFPWVLSPRIMFFYHYSPAIPFLTIITALWFYRWWSSGLFFYRLITGLCLATIGFTALWFLPIWLGIPLPNTVIEHYFWLPSWK
jgi:dolichyl-phosphate-mannose-protein mannosyltransferase